MPVTEHQEATKADLTSVRTLIKSVTKIAKHLRLSNNAIYIWIRNNRIPASHLVKVANFYDVELRDLLQFAGSETSHKNIRNLKPRVVLSTLVQVYRGLKSLEDAEIETGQSSIALKAILTNWGDELPTLYSTLEELDKGHIDLEEACCRLNVKKYTLHGLRRSYGYAPRAAQQQAKIEKRQKIDEFKETREEAALQCIAGNMTAQEAAENFKISTRTVFRAIDELGSKKIMELVKWPRSMRLAYADEIRLGGERYAEAWVEFAERSRLFMPKDPVYPETPATWRGQTLRRLLVGVLLGEAPLEDIAKSRGADPGILKTLFTGDLQSILLTYEQVSQMGVAHQVALAELLIATMNRKRKWS